VCAACASDSTSPPKPRGVAGAYGLASLNGQVLPAVLGQNDTAKVELLSGGVSLQNDGTFIDGVVLRVTLPSGVTVQGDTIRGGYMMSGKTLMLAPSDGSNAYFMTVTDEHTLTEDDIGFLIVYRRD
jgi:hypothetical protein